MCFVSTDMPLCACVHVCFGGDLTTAQRFDTQIIESLSLHASYVNSMTVCVGVGVGVYVWVDVWVCMFWWMGEFVRMWV